MDFVNTVQVDVVIVGGGLAGLYTALQLAPRARVALLSKGALALSNSMQAQGGIAAALAPDDSPELHLADTLEAGRGLCSPRAAEILVREGPACVRDLLELGVPFERQGEALSLGLEGGHQRRRILHAGGAATGAVVTGALAALVRQQEGVTIHEGMAAVQLLEGEGGCSGVLAHHRASGQWWRFVAPATILATGGAAALYARSTNPSISRGDGVALAYRAGAAVADIEFVQFHPTALALPGAGGFLISEAVRGEGALLRNLAGERFMPRYHPLGELAPRDVVSAAIVAEMRATGAPHMLLDLSPIDPAVVRGHFAALVERCRTLGLDMLREPLPVAPAAHYCMGGIYTDHDGATTLPGLFACGEVACTGVQGANRLASNSLLECLVFGRRAALAALRWAERGGAGAALAPSLPPLPSPDDEQAGEGGRQVAELLWKHAGLIREESGLRRLAAALDGLAGQAAGPGGQNARLVARLIARSALLREESRGGHLRADFPEERPLWRRRILLQQGQTPRYVELDHPPLVTPAGSSTLLAPAI